MDYFQSQDRFNRTWNIATGIILIFWIVAVLGITGLLCLGIRSCKAVEKDGLKVVISRVWDGPATNAPPQGVK